MPLVVLICICLFGALIGCQSSVKTDNETGIVSNSESDETADTIEDTTLDEGVNKDAGDADKEDVKTESTGDEISDVESMKEESPDTDSISEAVSNDDSADKEVVDMIFFMGQSNMSGCGGNADKAPQVNEGAGYEFRSISDPSQLYDIKEPFGVNENYIGALFEVATEKKGSLVSAFVNKYYEETNVPIVAVSASKGATTSRDWISEAFKNDYVNRYQKAIDYLNDNNYSIRHQYVVWLQGESDSISDVSSDEYKANIEAIFTPLFDKGLEKVFFITPGRTLTATDVFNNIVAVQKNLSKTDGRFALATTMLSYVSTECMVDEWHYNQHVLNTLGEEAAKAVAYYSNTGKEKCLFDYKNQTVFVPEGYEYSNEDMNPEVIDVKSIPTDR